MASFALGMAAVNLLGGKTVVLCYAIFSSVVLCSLSLAWQEPSKAKCNVYLFIVEATYIQIPGALDYWYTADTSCVANGPNFDMTYYLTYTNMVGAFASIVGIALFQAKMSKWPFRRAFMISSLVRISSSFFDIFIVTRTNIRLGIPDKLAYLFGDALILNTASMMVSMPAVVLTAKIVNDGLESTTYAILAGFQNFGSNVSKSLGIVMMGYFGIDADSRPCDFSRLSALIFVCHSVAPLLPIFLVHLMIDEVRDGDLNLSGSGSGSGSGKGVGVGEGVGVGKGVGMDLNGLKGYGLVSDKVDDGDLEAVNAEETHSPKLDDADFGKGDERDVSLTVSEESGYGSEESKD